VISAAVVSILLLEGREIVSGPEAIREPQRSRVLPSTLVDG